MRVNSRKDAKTQRKARVRFSLGGLAPWRETLFSFCVLLSVFAAISSHAEHFGDVQIVPSGVPLQSRDHGYVDHRFQIENGSLSQTHTIQLVAPERTYGGGDRIGHLERSVTVPPMSSVSVSVLQPPVELGGNNVFNVRIDGRGVGTIQAKAVTMNRYYYSGNNTRSVLTSQGLNAETLKGKLWPASLTNKAPRHSYQPQEVSVVRAEQPMDMWSDQWLSYSSFDGISLSADELHRAPAPVVTALWRYVTCGGMLIVLGDWDPPAALRLAPLESVLGGTVYQAGFGCCVEVTAHTSDEMTEQQATLVNQRMRTASEHWDRNNRGSSNLAARLPVTESVSFPVRSMFWLVFVAAALIGPVNLWLVARKNRHIWLLWTVPTLSLATCVIILIYALLSEGITPFTRVLALTILDEKHAESSTIGIVGHYCPLTPSDGLMFSGDTEVSPLLENNRYGSGQMRDMSWDQGQHLSVGWVASRVPAYFEMRKPGLQRERLEVTFTGTSCSVVNGLGSKITHLKLADAEGRLYEGEMIDAGEKVELVRDLGGNHAAVLYPGRFQDWYRANWEESHTNLVKWAVPVTSNSYIAVLEGSPFLENGLAGKANRTLQSVVVGFPQEPYAP